MNPQQFDDPLVHLRPAIASAEAAGIQFGLVARCDCTLPNMSIDAPFVIILCDDTGEAVGPSAFHHALLHQLLNQADTAIIHAWALEPLIYAAALAEAIFLRHKVVVVETRLSHEQEWVSLIVSLENIRLVITTPGGGRA